MVLKDLSLWEGKFYGIWRWIFCVNLISGVKFIIKISVY